MDILGWGAKTGVWVEPAKAITAISSTYQTVKGEITKIDGQKVTVRKKDGKEATVAVDGELINMPLKEFELLEVLMRNAGRVLTRGQLIDRVWGSDYFGDTKTLDVHIKRIRSRIEEQPSEPVMLVTVRGLGYRFEA